MTENIYIIYDTGDSKGREVTLEEWCRYERAAGFLPKLPSDHPNFQMTPATSRFSGNGMRGRVLRVGESWRVPQGRRPIPCRHQIPKETFSDTLERVRKKLIFRLNQKGVGAFASNHEILGILQEEMTEYESEIHQNSSDEKKVEELLDIAVAAVVGIASITSGGTEW